MVDEGHPVRGPVALLLVAVATPAEAVPPLEGPDRPLDDELLDRLVGSWRQSGTIQGEPAEQTLEVAWVLDRRLLCLHSGGWGSHPSASLATRPWSSSAACAGRPG